jgi:hypothetical protein
MAINSDLGIDTQYRRLTGRPVIWEKIAFDSSAESTSALTAGDTYQVVATEDCHLAFAATGGAATTGDSLLPAMTFFEWVEPHTSSGIHLHVIKNSNAGDLYVSTLSKDLL